MKFKPVTTIEELNALNDGELIKGYQDGCRNIQLNSSVLSQSYLHGYNNGQADFGYSPVSIEQQELARLIVNDGYLISAYCNS